MNTLINEEYDFEKTVVLGDVYISPDSRGKGYAQILVEKACKKVLEGEVANIVLIPQPFEYIDKKQTILSGEPDYQEKVEKLIKLYENCGFEKIDESEIFMVLSKAENTDLAASSKS